MLHMYIQYFLDGRSTVTKISKGDNILTKFDIIQQRTSFRFIKDHPHYLDMPIKIHTFRILEDAMVETIYPGRITGYKNDVLSIDSVMGYDKIIL